MIHVEITMNFPNLDFKGKKKLLEEVTGKIHDDIHRNLRNSRTPEGGPIAALKESTIKRKRRKGYAHPNAPLIAKGVMQRAISKKSNSKEGIVKIISRGEPPRDILAKIHEEKGVNRYTRTKRKFFGVSPKLGQWIEGRAYRWVNNVVKNAKMTTTKIYTS